jgi:hypothetical protein
MCLLTNADNLWSEINQKEREYNHKYYLENKERIMERLKTHIVCECGCAVQKMNMAKHRATKKHITTMNHIETLLRRE